MAGKSLSSVPVVYVDSRVAIELARECGLKPDARIRTSSPALLCSDIAGVEPVGAHISATDRSEFFETMRQMPAELHDAFSSHGNLSDFAVIAARTAILFCGRLLFQATSLTNDDFDDARGVVTLDTGNERLDTVLNPSWPVLLRDNPGLVHLKAKVVAERESDVEVSLFDRLRLSPWARAYRALTWLSGRAPWLFPRGSALIVAGNELLRETAVHLAFRGFRLEQLAIPHEFDQAIDIEPDIRDRLEAVARATIAPHIDRWSPVPAHEILSNAFVERLVDAALLQRRSREVWKQALGRAGNRRCQILLTNYPKGAYSHGLLAACRDSKIPMVAFQHGVTREICQDHDILSPWYEVACSDLTLTFNDRAAEISSLSKYAAGNAVATGMPSEFSRMAYFRRARRDSAPILYVSTNLFAGYHQMSLTTRSDLERAREEMRLIDEVLDGLPHRVCFKTYPEIRYWDPNPVTERAKSADNLEVFDRKQNLRYLLPDCRVIVTGRATSTTSFCLMSGKPMVFIDDPREAPLLPDVKEAFAKAVFLFHAGESDCYARLRKFLSQPIETIESQWRAKAGHRKELVKRFFAKEQESAGRASAEFLMAHLVSRQGELPKLGTMAGNETVTRIPESLQMKKRR